jgi:superfamily I DNA/RNA helicase
LILLELTDEQRRAVEAPLDQCFAIVGPAGSGKSTALARRLARLRELRPDAEPLLLNAEHTVEEYAVGLLEAHVQRPTLVDDVEAELVFAEACAPLFALQWQEFAENQLDPEVPALRSPERFLRSAFRLIRRLRDADITPALFLSRALAGATEFYANPPNFADPALLAATKSCYHDSVAPSSAELLRQHRREIDLAKIITKLYEGYINLLNDTARMTGRDAVIAAATLVEQHDGLAALLRERHPVAFVDDAAELTGAELRLLTAVYGEELARVTLCGDPASPISTLRIANPTSTFAFARSKVELRGAHCMPKRDLGRFATVRDEAQAIADRVAGWLAEGCPPEKIAVLFRSVRCVAGYEAALLDRNIPAFVAGDVNVFADRRALDALALLWNVHDPFRHDWLLRTLANPAWGLSDASLAILCGEPPDPQRQLFAFDEEPPPTARASRWDPKRDLRLGWNVIRGERDDELSPTAASRIARFRRLREAWLATMDRVPFETFARTVWREGLAREGEPNSARARAQQVALSRLLDRLNAFLARNAGATISDVLVYAEQRADSELETWAQNDESSGFVQILSLDAARGREFDHVVIANVRPGAFPQYYSPDAFAFSPRYGMIPKENAGDMHASRTAKFTYYMFRSKAPANFFDRERHAFEYALRRGRRSVLVTASGTPIRSAKTPEFLEELR